VTWAEVALQWAVRRGSPGGALIKGEVASEPSPGLVPGYSASGQDIWLERSQFHGPGLVVSAVGARCGKVFHAEGSWGVVANTAVLLPRPGYHPRFLWYCLNREDFWEKGGTAQPYVLVGETLRRRIRIPSLEVQRRIADYLDTETGRIDDLIDKNDALSRTSVERLHGAVVEATLGRPQRPEAQSLEDVFGSTFVPVHTVARVGTGHTPSRKVAEYWQDCKIPWLNIPDLAEARDFWRDEVSETAEHLNTAGLENSAAILCPVGTVFVTRTASIGHAAINSVPMATNQRLVTYYPDPRRLDVHFLLWSIRALKLIGHFDRLTFGATHDTIYYDDMVALRVPFRDVVEQQAAVVPITELRDEVAALRERLDRSSRLLRERRQALVTAAVTGELGV
jgi:type I restriction enzyme, S subunit